MIRRRSAKPVERTAENQDCLHLWPEGCTCAERAAFDNGIVTAIAARQIGEVVFRRVVGKTDLVGIDERGTAWLHLRDNRC